MCVCGGGGGGVGVKGTNPTAKGIAVLFAAHFGAVAKLNLKKLLKCWGGGYR